MVDFQSRDTNRGFGSDDEDEDEENGETTEEESEAAPTDQTDAGATDEQVPETEQTDSTGMTDGVATPSETAADPADTPTGTATESEATAYAVVTVTDGRTLSEDSQGDLAVAGIEAAGDRVLTRDLVQSGYDNVQSAVATLAQRADIDVVVTIGGTGVEPTDVTVDAVEPIFEKHLPGVGELFRLLAHETEGTAVVGTRATAGIVDQTPVFVLPGTVSGVELGMEEIVLQEAPHLAADTTAGQQ